MANQKDILVSTTSTIEGVTIIKYLKPITSHLVAGTNLFSDFAAGLTDIFGGRSGAYQKQLSALYLEAIERIKYNAFELGGNCIIGLKIDFEEISGKGKSMFMITAIGTAVVIEKNEKSISKSINSEKFENVGVERINNLRRKLEIIEKAKLNKVSYDEDTWLFITSNQLVELFPYILERYSSVIENSQYGGEVYDNFNKNFIGYIDSLEYNVKVDLLYDKIESESNYEIALYLARVIKELNLLDFEKNMKLLKTQEFKKQKIGFQISTFDKPFYNKSDIGHLNELKTFIALNFKERGEISNSKQIFSSRNKEVWNCECGAKEWEIGDYCGSCNNDIFGFKKSEMNPNELVKYLNEKIELINSFLN